jgi:hypothetical protein
LLSSFVYRSICNRKPASSYAIQVEAFLPTHNLTRAGSFPLSAFPAVGCASTFAEFRKVALRGVAKLLRDGETPIVTTPARRSQFQFAYPAGSRSRSPCGVRRIASRCLAPLSDHGLALAFHRTPLHRIRLGQDPLAVSIGDLWLERSRASSSATSRSSSSLVFTDSSFPSLAAAASQARRARARRPRRQSLLCSHWPPSRPQTCCGGSPN